MGYSPWGCKESDMTEQGLSFLFSCQQASKWQQALPVSECPLLGGPWSPPTAPQPPPCSPSHLLLSLPQNAELSHTEHLSIFSVELVPRTSRPQQGI